MTFILFSQEGANAGKQAQVKAFCFNEHCLPAGGPSWLNPPGAYQFADQLRWKALKTGRYPATSRLTDQQIGKRRMEAINRS
jgi:hypothetical protein